MTTMIVRAEIDGTIRKYTVDLAETPLGSGATAIVRRGLDKDETNKTDPYYVVAVKIAYSGTHRPQLDQFMAEYRLLQELGKKTETNHVHVPRAFLGIALRDGQVDETLRDHIIVQEFIEAKWELRRFADADHRLPEDVALASAQQYATLLKTMHEMDIVSMGDRKATDLRWVKEASDNYRLVVLDWNRAQKVTPGDQKRALVRQDIQLFGRLWAEQLLACDVRDLPTVDDPPSDDEAWNSLRRAWRRILKQSLDSRSAWGYQSADDILRDIEQYERDRVKSYQQLIAEAEMQQKAGETNVSTRMACADRILTLLDWAKAKEEPGDDKVEENLETWAMSYFSGDLRALEEAIGLMKKNLDKNRGYYDEAVYIYKNYRPKISSSPMERQSLLRLTRWGIVAEVGQFGLSKLRQPMAEPVEKLTACVEALEQEKIDLGLAYQRYNEFKNWITNKNNEQLVELADMASPLLDEIEIRQAFAQPSVGDSNG
jgi:hypothetical protein